MRQETVFSRMIRVIFLKILREYKLVEVLVNEKTKLKYMFVTTALAVSLLAGCSGESPRSTLSIEQQGNFSAGGTVIKQEGTYDPKNPFAPGGQTLHGDHADVFYQIPENAKEYPLVFLHGAGQSKRSWQTTPDGREGFHNIFLRKGYGVYLVDQPRRGDAGQSTVPEQINPVLLWGQHSGTAVGCPCGRFLACIA